MHCFRGLTRAGLARHRFKCHRRTCAYIYIYIRGERVILSHRIRGILGNVFSRRREQRFYMLGAMRFCWNWQLHPPRKFDDFWSGVVALAKPVVSRRRERRFRCVMKKRKVIFQCFLSRALGEEMNMNLCFCVFSPSCHIASTSHRDFFKASLQFSIFSVLFWGITAELGHKHVTKIMKM